MTKLIHKFTGFDRILFLLENFGKESPVGFIKAGAKEFQVSAKIKNHLNQNVMRSTIFVSNHHTGALDFLATYPEICRYAPDLKIVVNKGLLRLLPMKPVFIAVHPVSTQAKNDLAKKEIIDHLESGGNLLIYPAGKVARKFGDTIEDFPWRNGLADIIKETSANVVPIYVDAENSRFFYLIRRFFPKLSLLFLLRELKNSAGKSATVYIGKPIEKKELANFDNRKMVQEIRNQVYGLFKDVSYE
jgi:putative hemolysin